MAFRPPQTSSAVQQGNPQAAVNLPTSQSHARSAPSVSNRAGPQPADPSTRKQPAKPQIPRHPIPSMQEAFAESLAEATSGTLEMKPNVRIYNAETRRKMLIDEDASQGPPAVLWRYRPGQKCHELRKLLAQISFGVYLLLRGMANSNAQVVAILQGHIDEVDDYLRTAMEDLDLAADDLTSRLEYLRMPLSNLPTYENMLEDPNFRDRVTQANATIKHILSRTNTFLLQVIQDVSEGLQSTKEFTAYLTSEEDGSWRTEHPAVTNIFSAMCGNVDGWLNTFTSLEEKCHAVNVLMLDLSETATEMDRRAAEAGQRSNFDIALEFAEEEFARASLDSEAPSTLSVEETTASLSPGLQISRAPPRLSLRFSTLDSDLGPDFLSLVSGASGDDATLTPLKPAPPPVQEPNRAPARHPPPKLAPVDLSDVDTSEVDTPTVQSVAKECAVPERVRQSLQPTKTAPGDDCDERSPVLDDTASRHTLEIADDTNDVDLVPVPLRINIDSPTMPSSHADTDSDEAPYLLQPRTYTPKPPAPLPSPRVHDVRPVDLPESSLPPQSAPQLAIPPAQERPSVYAPTSPGFPTEAQVLRLRAVSARVPPREYVAEQRQPERQSVMHSSMRDLSSRSGETLQKKRGSIRDRVSLRTQPPNAIHVPPPNAQPLQRPVFASPRTYENYQTFTGPDSAYSAEADRFPTQSYAEVPRSTVNSNGHEFSPPVFPGMVPSPHSEQQYFRPVQASPHSPLQQRPHTAGQVQSRPHHLRNAPSSMGMSMLSSVTTMTQDSNSGRTLKKKRSAFGWLKKAFTLDDDERAEFDQRKKAQERNRYYDSRSPRFLDGRRIQ